MSEGLVFPESAAERDTWILRSRPQRNKVTPDEPYAFFLEEERGASGQVERVATIFLANRECPFRCTMCDLWRNTLADSLPAGAIPKQIEFALSRMGSAHSVKLYNSGSFFDPRAIPPDDYKPIAERVRGFGRAIVECHPALVGERCIQFRDLLRGRLEVAMGLETVHPDVLSKLNKQMTLDQFSAAADFLQRHTIELRVFILVQPPFMNPDESLHWAQRSLDFAFDCGATAATLIPTRTGNGAMELLAEAGLFAAPELNVVEDAMAYGLRLRRGRVFTDLWEIKLNAACPHCFDTRVQRLREMNLLQTLTPSVHCDACGFDVGRRIEPTL